MGACTGSQYRSGIYYHDDSQKNAAEAAIAAVNDKLKSSTWRRVLGSQVVTELKPTGDYWLAEKVSAPAWPQLSVCPILSCWNFQQLFPADAMPNSFVARSFIP